MRGAGTLPAPGALPLDQVADYADSILAQKISQVSGVGLVTLNGGQKPAVRVQVDPTVLAGLGLSLEDIRAAVIASNVNQPKGNLDGVHQSYMIAADDQLTRASAYRPLVIAYKNGAPVRASVEDIEWTLGLTIMLVVAVIFVFLRDWRATTIPAVAVPLSLIGTFGVMYLLDYSLDNLSLMALTISTGFVVDDAIVVTENITRFIEKGDSPLEAALKGAKQIGFTIVSITVSLLAVFIPLLRMGGIIGRLFREFAVTLSVAIAVSALVSLTLTPRMCSRLLKHEPVEARGRFYRASERVFQGMLALYARGLGWVLEHRKITLTVLAGTLGVTIGLFVIIPKGLFPQQDTGFLTGFSEASQDVSFTAMKAGQERLNAIVRADPAVAHMVSFIGAGGQSTGNTGTMFIELKPMEQRKTSADAVIARLRPQLAQIPGMVLYLQSAQDVRIGGRPARTQYQYRRRALRRLRPAPGRDHVHRAQPVPRHPRNHARARADRGRAPPHPRALGR